MSLRDKLNYLGKTKKSAKEITKTDKLYLTKKNY